MVESINPVVEAIHTRRSLRRYTDDPVPDTLIEAVLKAASWAPSAHNRQPWRFAVLVAEASKVRLARAMGDRLRADLSADRVPEAVIEKDVNRSYERLTRAPVLIVLCLTMADMDTYRDEARNHNEYVMAVQSTAMAGQNLLLAAHSYGLGACWMCAPLFCPDTVRSALALPDDWQPQGIITLGYPAQTRTRSRESLETRIVWR